MTEAPRLLLPAEVGELLRTPEDTLRHWRNAGKGPLWVKLGRRILYREADVLDWLAEQTDAARTQQRPTLTGATPVRRRRAIPSR